MSDQTEALETARQWLAEKPVFLDCETTGFDDDDQIVELAIVDADGKELFNRRIRPTIPIPAEASRYHGIYDADVAGCPTMTEVWPEIERILSGRLICTYNAAYDHRMLSQSLGWSEVLTLPGWRCVMELYAAYHGVWSEYHGNYKFQKLSYAARCLGIPAWVEHGARADAEAARLVLVKMAALSIT